MLFEPPAWVPKLPFDPPNSISIADFIRDERYGRYPTAASRNPFKCGLTGKTFSTTDAHTRTENLAKAIAKHTGLSPQEGTPWDKVICVFSVNTIDYLNVLHAIHRLNGIATPANAAYSVDELTNQLKSSGAVAMFACTPLLNVALQAASNAGISHSKVFVMDIPGFESSENHLTIEHLITEGQTLPALESLNWTRGQGARQPALLCYSSGTSGLPKAVMISHMNVIANVLQYKTFASVGRVNQGIETQVVLGVLPFSHIYGLVVIAHSASYMGDEVVVLPRFDFKAFLSAIESFKISQLFLVPPMVIRMVQSKDELRRYDLSSVRCLFTGAAPIGAETLLELRNIYSGWNITQGYGLTETTALVACASEHDSFDKSSGSLLPAMRAKLIGLDGKEIADHNEPGELLIQSPSLALGYLNNEKATAETFVHDEQGRWMKTGDEVILTKAPSGNEHIIIVDRIKELIKVKGHQVAPAELEAHLLSHPAVADCAVIQVPDDRAGEVPKAYVVKDSTVTGKPEDVARDIIRYVQKHKAPYKWIQGGIEFVELIPKSPSGKILRRTFREKETLAKRASGAKI